METEPTFTSFWSIRKIGEMRICSLWRKFVEMAILSYTSLVPSRGTRHRVIRTPMSPQIIEPQMKTVNVAQEFRLSYQCRSDFICGYKFFL